MAANTSAIYVATPVVAHGRVSATNTNRDGTGTRVDLVTGAANGTRIDKITMIATGTTTAGMLRFFLNDGSNVRALHEITVEAITPSASVAAWAEEWVRDDDLPLVTLESGWILQVATHNAETFDVTIEGGSY